LFTSGTWVCVRWGEVPLYHPDGSPVLSSVNGQIIQVTRLDCVEKKYYKGHGDFSNDEDNCFDWNREDSLWSGNGPYPLGIGTPSAHFQDFSTSASQVNQAIANCDVKAFQSAMHRLQDFNTHAGKGFTYENWWSGPRGHFGANPNPDLDNDAWNESEGLTQAALRMWKDSCCLKKCGTTCEYVKRSAGPCK